MKDINFEKALEQLEKIVEKLEVGDLPLDAMLKKYEEGVKLAALCQEKLNKAKERIETLVKQGDGSFKKTVFDNKEE